MICNGEKMLIFIAISVISIKYVTSEWGPANYSPEQFQNIPGYGDSWMYIPDGNGIPRTAYLTYDEYEDLRISINRKNRKVHKEVTFDLYTRKNPSTPQELILDDVPTLKKSNLDFSKDIKIITHGWMSSNKSNICQDIKNKYLKTKDYNVIIADWAPISHNIFYFLPMMDTKKVGAELSRMVQFLVDNGAKLDQFHLIGHSLGAHVCGYAGAGIKHGRINRITGLDPALPGFQMIADNSHRLDASDAHFVDIIHTCGGTLGYSSSIGTADFYPNGGTPSQPGCSGLMHFIEACSHGRAWQYFAESIGNPKAFPAVQCDSWDDYKNNNCKNRTVIPMGEEVLPHAHGDFYLRTSQASPYHAV